MKLTTIARTVTGALAASIVAAVVLVGGGAAQAAEVHADRAAVASSSATVSATVPTTIRSDSDVKSKSCGAKSTDCFDTEKYGDFLPLNRFRSAVSAVHTRFAFQVSSIVDQVDTKIYQKEGMLIGSFCYGLADDFIQVATNFDPLNAVGAKVDNLIGTIGSFMFGSAGSTSITVVFLLVVFGVVSAVIGAMRRGPVAFRRLIGTALVVAFLATSVAGAARSTDVNGKFVPGFLSPGFVMQKAQNMVSLIGGLPSAGQLSVSGSALSQTIAPSGSLCANTLDSMNSEYSAGLNGGVGNVNDGSIPLAVSNLWTVSGVGEWVTEQYGDSVQNPGAANPTPFSANSWCIQLSEHSGVSAKTIAKEALGSYSGQIGNPAFVNTKAAWWNVDMTDNNAIDQQMVMQLVCVPTITSSGVTVKILPAASKIASDADCKAGWFDSGDDVLGKFNVGGKNSNITQNLHDDVSDYGQDMIDRAGGASALEDQEDQLAIALAAIHGSEWKDTGQGQFAAWGYAFGGLASLASLGALAIFTIVARLGIVGLMITMFMLMLRATLDPGGAKEPAIKFAKQALGLIIIAFGTTFLLSLLVTIATLGAQLGLSFANPGSPLLSLWTGFCPIFGLILLNIVLKKAGMPGVLKPSDGVAWMKNSGVIGAKAVAAVDRREKQIEGRAAQGAKWVGKKSGQEAKEIGGKTWDGLKKIAGVAVQGQPERAPQSMGAGAAENAVPKDATNPQSAPNATRGPKGGDGAQPEQGSGMTQPTGSQQKPARKPGRHYGQLDAFGRWSPAAEAKSPADKVANDLKLGAPALEKIRAPRHTMRESSAKLGDAQISEESKGRIKEGLAQHVAGVSQKLDIVSQTMRASQQATGTPVAKPVGGIRSVVNKPAAAQPTRTFRDDTSRRGAEMAAAHLKGRKRGNR